MRAIRISTALYMASLLLLGGCQTAPAINHGAGDLPTSSHSQDARMPSTTPRIPFPDTSELSAETLAVLEPLEKVNSFRMMSHAPHLLKPFIDYGLAFRNNSHFDPITREVAILRAGFLSGSDYETDHHIKSAKKSGMSDALIEVIKVGPTAKGLSVEHREILSFVDDVVTNVRASDATFNPILARYGPAATQELTLLTGFYMLVCRFLETFDVPK